MANQIKTWDGVGYASLKTFNGVSAAGIKTINGLLLVLTLPSLGYFSGGNSGAYATTTDGLAFATDTTTQVTKGALSQARQSLAGANSSTLAYFSGGYANAYVTTTDGLTFSTDTTTQVTKGALSQARRALTGAQSGSV